MSQALQFPAERNVVVDFSIIDDDLRYPIGMGFHGLMATCNIDDAQSAMAQADPSFHMDALIIGAPVRRGGRHAGDQG